MRRADLRSLLGNEEKRHSGNQIDATSQEPDDAIIACACQQVSRRNWENGCSDL